jgi:hypothetical protein
MNRPGRAEPDAEAQDERRGQLQEEGQVEQPTQRPGEPKRRHGVGPEAQAQQRPEPRRPRRGLLHGERGVVQGVALMDGAQVFAAEGELFAEADGVISGAVVPGEVVIVVEGGVGVGVASVMAADIRVAAVRLQLLVAHERGGPDKHGPEREAGEVERQQGSSECGAVILPQSSR